MTEESSAADTLTKMALVSGFLSGVTGYYMAMAETTLGVSYYYISQSIVRSDK